MTSGSKQVKFPVADLLDATSAGRSLLTAANASAQRTLLGIDKLVPLSQVAAPTTAVTATAGSAGSISTSLRYFVSYVTADGETEPGLESSVVTASSQRINITDIPIGPSGVTARKLWRAGVVGQNQVRLELVTTISDNTTTIYTDNAATLGGVYRSCRNTTGGYITINGDAVAVIGNDLTSFGIGNGVDPIGPKNSFFGNSIAVGCTTGYWNCLFGDESGHSITEGFENAFYGNHTGRATTTGWYNSAFGVASFRSNTTGINNSVFGFGALADSTTGNSNTVLGTFAANKSATSNGFVAVGYNARRYLADGITDCLTGDNGVYIGNDCRASADGTANEIAIGLECIGSGSNTVTLGNTSITQTFLRGALQTAGDVWHKGAGSERFYFTPSGETYYRAAGATPHQWMNSAGDVRMALSTAGNLNVVGSFQAGSFAGALSLDGSVWHKGAGAERIYFEPSSMTFYRGYGGNPHQWMDGSGNVIMILNSGGRLDFTTLGLEGYQVTYGAADSGGTGYKVLRVPN